MLKDFNIEEKANGTGKPYTENFYNVGVTGNTLEIVYIGLGKEPLAYLRGEITVL